MTVNKGVINFTANGIAIGGNTANVILDAGGANDALAIPSGHTIERPAGLPGYFRYNKDLAAFEGFTTLWAPIGGASRITIQNNNVTVNTANVLDFSNGTNILMNVV